LHSEPSLDHATQCSTPFGIRGRNATLKILYLDPIESVLNAFRHQRKKRDKRKESLERAEYVLNAFRHQRKKRTWMSTDTQSRTFRCSTPFGIRGRNACSRLSQFATACCVLNAFRHQRKKRLIEAIEADAVDWECSTPFGIRGRNAGWYALEPHYADLVLNAFRHQRKKRS